jgi:hypothetical protein
MQQRLALAAPAIQITRQAVFSNGCGVAGNRPPNAHF